MGYDAEKHGAAWEVCGLVEWLLIVQVFTGQAPVVNQLGPFKTEAACIQAAERIRKTMVGTRFVCVPNAETS